MWKKLICWLFGKWLIIFMLSVLVHPEVLDEVPGPSNIDTAVSRKKRRLVASCRNCGFLANHKDELENHQCTEELRESQEPSTTESQESSSEGKDQQNAKDETLKPQNRHKKTKCSDCGSVMRVDNLKAHTVRCKIRCKDCGKRVSPGEFKDHKEIHEWNLRNSFPESSASSSQNADDEDLEQGEFNDIYEEYDKFIKTASKFGRIMDTFNFKVDQFSPNELIYRFKSIFKAQKNSFKVKISLGVILFNKTTEEYAFYRSSQNNQLLLDQPTLIRNSSDKASFIRKLESLDLIAVISRPNSQWTIAKVTNVTFFVYKLTGTPIGSPVELPSHLANNKGLISLTKRKGKAYNDKLCFFRSLSLHMGLPLDGLEGKAKELKNLFCEKGSIKEFEGVTLDQLEEISRIFKVAINVYEQDEKRNTDLIFRTITESDNPLNLNLYGEHFSFIKNLAIYSQSYRCSKCDKIWSSSNHFHRHVRNCEAGVKHKYGTGTFELRPTVFEALEGEGVIVPLELRPFPFMTTYDIECMLKKEVDINDTAKINYTSKHELASVSVCSNVPGFTSPKCFILPCEGGQKQLVKKFVDYLMKISETSSTILRERYSKYLDQIKSERTLQRFEEYITQLPVLSFNGASYDLRILKEFLIPVIIDLDSLKFVIKKSTSYMAIVTEELRFLDVMYYIAPSFNYSQFLHAYGANAQKGFFPYDWFNDLKKLESDRFPSYQDFYSSLKGSNTLQPTATEMLSADEVNFIGRKPSKSTPLTSDEMFKISQLRYETVSNMFYENKWTMKDYLIHYNNADVKPFLSALKNMSKYYIDRGVDAFKDGFSVPGIAERLAFKTLKSDENFLLFNKRNADLVELFRGNNVGGPAIIFDRYQEAGVTNIRHNNEGKQCKRILGYDANALYLWCMQQQMPCGMFLRRKREDLFEKKYPKPHSAACSEWMGYLEATRGIDIQHARNGTEFRVGSRKIPVDGYCRESKTVFQFHGCYFHGCLSCFKSPQHDREESRNGWRSFDDRYKATGEVSVYISDEGYRLEVIWECEWKDLKKTVEFKNKYSYPGESNVYMRESQILAMVMDGSMFGVVEVDIEVPEELKDYFAEMTPVFKNTTISLSDIGVYMTDHLAQSKQNFRDRRCLIGSMFGTKILVITPLLIWYVEHGLKVTKIYQVIQFDPKECFKRFGDQVSDDRRAGDADISKKIIGDTSKLIGNSVYGHSIMDKSKHTAVKFCDIEKASKAINDPFFSSFEECGEETFEITLKKKSIKHDLPIQLGFFVYQYAKMRMLSFYYDVVDRFVDRQDYCVLEMDTDSLYLAVSGMDLDSVVKPEMTQEWEEAKKEWFPRIDSKSNAAYDLRTPGLFKMEWEGDGFVGLAAKTYYCFHNDSPDKDKHSAKGINRNFRLSKEDYLKVLNKDPKQELQVNKGFIVKGQSMYTYELTKKGLDHLYVKRKVLDNGISTTYLDI